MRAFTALALAIVRGFVRDRSSLFFSILFPLMFLVFFGGLLSGGSDAPARLVQVGDVPVLDSLDPAAREALDDAFDVERADDLDAAVALVRDGDADVVVSMAGDVLVARYTQTDQVQAAVTQATLRALVDGANVAQLARDAGSPPPYALQVERVEDESLTVIQFFTPGLLGWAIATNAAIGAAATLQGWRQSKLMRRLQLAPVGARSVVAARVVVTLGIAAVQTALFLGVAMLAFGLTLSGSWWAAMPLVLVGTLCFMAVGLLAGALTRTAEAAVNAANFMVLPMAFLSGSFFSLEGAPRWLEVVSSALPLKHLNEGMLDVMVRGQDAAAALPSLGVLAAFAVVITLLAARLFRWEST